jgi:hypothetical protein
MSPKTRSSAEVLAMIEDAIDHELLEFLPDLNEPDLLIQIDELDKNSAYAKLGIRIADFEEFTNEEEDSPPEAGWSVWVYFKIQGTRAPALDIFLYSSNGLSQPENPDLRRYHVIREQYEKLFFDEWLEVCEDEHKENV